MSSAFYQRRICKGLCLQLDTLGLCMGLCTTEPAYVQRVYDNAAKQHQATGKPFDVIPYYAAQEWRNEALMRWLGDSKTLSEQGAPRRFYLQATESISEMPEAIWCSASPDHAGALVNHYPPGIPGGINTMPIYIKSDAPLQIKTDVDGTLTWPLILNNAQQCTEARSIQPLIESSRAISVSALLSSEAGQSVLRQCGFDAVCLEIDGSETWLVLHAKNIKSALGNSGKFSTDAVSLTDRPVKKSQPARQLIVEGEAPVVFYCGTRQGDLPEMLHFTRDPTQAYQQAIQYDGEGEPQVLRVTIAAATAQRVTEKAFHRPVAPMKGDVDGVYLDGYAQIKISHATQIESKDVIPAWHFAREHKLFPEQTFSVMQLATECMKDTVEELNVDQWIRLLQQRYRQQEGAPAPISLLEGIVRHITQNGTEVLPLPGTLMREIPEHAAEQTRTVEKKAPKSASSPGLR